MRWRFPVAMLLALCFAYPIDVQASQGAKERSIDGRAVPDDVRHRHLGLIALSKPVLPARLIGELRKLIRSSGAHPLHG